MQGVGDAHRTEASIKEGDACLLDVGPGDAFGLPGDQEAQKGADEELGDGEPKHSVVFWSFSLTFWTSADAVDQEDMEGPEKGSSQNECISSGKGEGLADAQEIESEGGEPGADPGPFGGEGLAQQSQDRDQENVESGDEASLPRGGRDQSDLLQACPAEKEEPQGDG